MAEIADAYIALYTQMPGVKSDIERGLSGAKPVADNAGAEAGQGFSAGFAGAVGGIFASVATRAMDTVASSVDGAISRVDTMNNFPLIMQNLGYSADEANDSITTISQGLQGLPTSLDAMAGTVQQLAPLTGGLDEATELSLALNNALLAGGKPAEQQANAMEQYTQMLAVGKVDMSAWRSMVSAMPGQMDQLAKSLLGASAGQTDLYEALQDGTLSFDDFNAAILDLNENGTGSFASFEEQALSATDGIATGAANLETAVTRGLAGVVDEMKPVVTALQEGLTDAVNVAFDALKGFVQWVGDNKDWLTPLAITVGIFTAGIWALNMATTVAAAGGLLKWIASTKIATGVQAAFNAVMAMNPIMLIVIAIAALVAGLIYFFTQTELGKEIWANFTQFLSDTWTNITTFLTEAWENIGQFFSDFWAGLQEFFAGALDFIVDLFLNWTVFGLIIQHWDEIVLFISQVWENITTFVSDGINAVQEWINNGLEAIGTWWNDFWGGLGDAVRDIFGGIGDFLGQAFQNVLDVVKAPINALIDLINGVIEGLNGISVEIPDWVPGVGGGTFGVNLPTIPRLAAGGLVRRTPGGILANIGEGRYDEAVVPLSPAVLAQLGGGGTTVQVDVHPQPGMSEASIGRAAAAVISRELRG